MVSATRTSGRIPSLDGLRALSITLVIASHLVGTDGFWIQARGHAASDVGYLGVRVFFVISGYLITRLLLAEHARTDTVSLGGFYARRAFRIFPAFYAFILAMVTAQALGAFTLGRHDVVHALTYTMNYHYERSWELGHLWSLSIEEQFYLVWPAMFLLARPRWLPHLATAMIALAPVVRVIAWFVAPHRDDVIMEAYPCVMDSIAAGSLLAAVQPRLDASAAYERFLRSPAFWLVPAAVVVLAFQWKVSLDYTIGITASNLGIAIIIDRAVRVDRGPAFRALNLRPVAWIGTLSYSIYLWQEPFLNPRSHATWATFPLNLVLALACAVGSYYLIERPFFRLRDRWARRRARRAPATPPR